MPAGEAFGLAADLRTVMIVGLGIDLVANRRVEREFARGDWRLEDGIFTAEEVRQCSGKTRPARAYAACFAAKEAALKALGVEVGDLGMWREVEVQFGRDGAQAIVLRGRLQSQAERLGVRHIRLSIAPAKQHTAAMVILES